MSSNKRRRIDEAQSPLLVESDDEELEPESDIEECVVSSDEEDMAQAMEEAYDEGFKRAQALLKPTLDELWTIHREMRNLLVDLNKLVQRK